MPRFGNRSSSSLLEAQPLPESPLWESSDQDSTQKTGMRLPRDSYRSTQSGASSSNPSSRSSGNNSSVANMDAYAKYLKKATTRTPKTLKRLEKAKKKLKFDKSAILPGKSDRGDDASTASPSATASISGFSTYSFDTAYHTIGENIIAKMFGHAKVKFHGRKKELAVLRDVYKEVCGSHLNRSHHRRKGSLPDESSHQSGTTESQSPPTSDHCMGAREAHRSVAFVSGLSGTGKSALVKQFIEGLKSDEHSESSSQKRLPEPLFLTGKYNELSGSDPFSAIVEAFAGLSLLLLDDEGHKSGNSDNSSNSSSEYAEDLVRIQRDVRASLRREDIAVLTAVIPALRKILSDDISLPSSTAERKNSTSTISKNDQLEQVDNREPEGSSTQNALNRLKYVLRLFTKTIATHKRPIVLSLDDLQWADNGSLDLLQSLVMDRGMRNFMFIGTYRADEVHEKHKLSERISRIQKAQPVETITLGNLSIDELKEFLHDHMKIDDYDCKKLAKKVHATTRGNMFYIIQILVELNQQCALNYSEFKKAWEWDEVAGMLVLETGLSENLEEAFEIKIRRLPKLMKRALITIAYARSTIDIDTLFKLMEMQTSSSNQTQNNSSLELDHLSKALDRAVLEGYLLNNIGSKYYSFAHDKVLQASYGLVPEGKPREKFRLSMGRRLYELGSKSGSSDDDVGGETWMLFAAAEHLNSSLSLTDSDPLFLARMNLDIGERASKVSAYDQASKCLMAGLDALMMIPDYDPWIEEYNLTLRLHRAVADVELYLGRFDRGNEIGRRLLEKARGLDDGLPTYEALAEALGREELHAESLEMYRDAMVRLGEYPKHNRIFNIVKELIAVQRYFKKTSDTEILGLPKMTDKSKDYALAFTQGLAIQAFYCDNKIEFLLSSLRALRITFKYGLSGYSALAIVAYGILLSFLHDHEAAIRLTKLSRNIMRKCQAREHESVFIFCAAHFIEGWADPHEKTVEAYSNGYLLGMEVGDVENAFMNAFHGVLHVRAAGGPLGCIEVMTGELLEQMDLYNVKSVLVAMEQVNIPVQYLTGTHRTIEPNWDELAIEPQCGSSKLTGSENQRLLFFYIARVELGVYFGNYEFAHQMAIKLRSVLPDQTAYVPLSFRLYYSGLAASGMAKKMHSAGKRMEAKRYHAKAKAYCKRLGRLNRTNGPNSNHRELIMLADLNLTDKDQKPVSYDRAINACLEVGHIHDAALGSELAGEFYLASDHSETKTVAGNLRNKLIRRHFTRARDLYQSWGAHAKVKHLHKTRGDYIEGSKVQQESGDRVVAIEIDELSSSHSHDDDTSRYSGIQAMHSNMIRLLSRIAPSSEDPSISENRLSGHHGVLPSSDDIEPDDLSVISDIGF